MTQNNFDAFYPSYLKEKKNFQMCSLWILEKIIELNSLEKWKIYLNYTSSDG